MDSDYNSMDSPAAPPMIFGREPSYLFESLDLGGSDSGCRVKIPETLIFRQVSYLAA